VDSFVHDGVLKEPMESLVHEDTSTFTGKLKVLCPSFYYSLTSWEMLALDSLTSPRLAPVLPSSVVELNKGIVSPSRGPTSFSGGNSVDLGPDRVFFPRRTHSTGLYNSLSLPHTTGGQFVSVRDAPMEAGVEDSVG
jgi:hypothetical protein